MFQVYPFDDASLAAVREHLFVIKSVLRVYCNE